MTRRIAASLSVAMLTACELPTRAPSWDVQWNVPSSTTRISVASLMPATVSVAPDSSAFRVDIAPVMLSRAVGADCAQCAGIVAPKPEFTLSASGSTALPLELAQATLVNDTLLVLITSTLTFDPLRPSAASGSARGHLVVRVRNGGATIGADSVNGADVAFAGGSTLIRRIPLAGTVTASAPVVLEGTLYSPAGDPVSADPSRTIAISASASNFLVSTANVMVSNRPVSASATDLDLSGVGESVSERVQSGALILGIDNPVAVSGQLDVQLIAPGVSITKPVTFGAGVSSERVEFTREELRSLFGKQIVVHASGPVSALGASVVLTPRQVIVVTTRMDLVVSTERGN